MDNGSFNPVATEAKLHCGVVCREWEGFGIYTVSTKVGDNDLPMETGTLEDSPTFIRCALAAAVTGIEKLPDEPLNVNIVTPSSWVSDLGNDQPKLRDWRARDWKREDGSDLPHSDLWARLLDETVDGDGNQRYEVSFTFLDGGANDNRSNGNRAADKRRGDRRSRGGTARGESDPSKRSFRSDTAARRNGKPQTSTPRGEPHCTITYNVATIGNSGVGAYILHLQFDRREKTSSSKLEVTNFARLHLIACIDAMRAAVDELVPRGRRRDRNREDPPPPPPQRIDILTPSDYVANSVNKGWLVRWSQNGWQREDEQPVRHVDLWKQFYAITKQHDVNVRLSVDSEATERLGMRARELAIKDSTKLRSDVEFKEQEEQDVKAGRTIRIHSDGAARDNPGRGGWGYVIQYKGAKRQQSKGYKLTTNNRMEIMGPLHALEQLVDLRERGKAPAEFKTIVITDSQYLVDAMTKGWAKRWRKNKWLKQSGERAKNTDLWNRMLRATDRLKGVEFRWTRGHGNDRGNNLADELARNAAKQPQHALATDEGFVPDADEAEVSTEDAAPATDEVAAEAVAAEDPAATSS